MNPETTKDDFRALLEMQKQIDALHEAFITRVKTILDESHPGIYPIVDLDGEVYQLRKSSATSQMMESGRKHRGFYFDYRLVKLGKPL